jgi:hypothetical protein
VYIEDLTWPEVKAAIAAGKTTANIYAGSTEQNGPHLALQLSTHQFALKLGHYMRGEPWEHLTVNKPGPLDLSKLTKDT